MKIKNTWKQIALGLGAITIVQNQSPNLMRLYVGATAPTDPTAKLGIELKDNDSITYTNAGGDNLYAVAPQGDTYCQGLITETEGSIDGNVVYDTGEFIIGAEVKLNIGAVDYFGVTKEPRGEFLIEEIPAGTLGTLTITTLDGELQGTTPITITAGYTTHQGEVQIIKEIFGSVIGRALIAGIPTAGVVCLLSSGQSAVSAIDGTFNIENVPTGVGYTLDLTYSDKVGQELLIDVTAPTATDVGDITLV